MLADRITFPHFSVSSAQSFPNSVGDSGMGAVPNSASRALIFGSARPALISPLSFSTISLGVSPIPDFGTEKIIGPRSRTEQTAKAGALYATTSRQQESLCAIG